MLGRFVVFGSRFRLHHTAVHMAVVGACTIALLQGVAFGTGIQMDLFPSEPKATPREKISDPHVTGRVTLGRSQEISQAVVPLITKVVAPIAARIAGSISLNTSTWKDLAKADEFAPLRAGKHAVATINMGGTDHSVNADFRHIWVSPVFADEASVRKWIDHVNRNANRSPFEPEPLFSARRRGHVVQATSYSPTTLIQTAEGVVAMSMTTGLEIVPHGAHKNQTDPIKLIDLQLLGSQATQYVSAHKKQQPSQDALPLDMAQKYAYALYNAFVRVGLAKLGPDAIAEAIRANPATMALLKNPHDVARHSEKIADLIRNGTFSGLLSVGGHRFGLGIKEFHTRIVPAASASVAHAGITAADRLAQNMNITLHDESYRIGRLRDGIIRGQFFNKENRGGRSLPKHRIESRGQFAIFHHGSAPIQRRKVAVIRCENPTGSFVFRTTHRR